MTRIVTIVLAVVLGLALCCGTAQADSITFTVGQDASLLSYVPSGKYGTGGYLWQWGDKGREIQTVIKFENLFGDDPDQIPLGSTITEASLRFYLYNSSSDERQVYQLTTDWNEKTATWNSFGGGVDVATQTTGKPVTSYTQSKTGFFGIDVSSSLQAWANGEANYGWAIISELSDDYDWSGIYSLNYSNVSLRPTLSVTYTSPSGATPEPGTIFLLGSALAGAAIWRRRRKKT